MTVPMEDVWAAAELVAFGLRSGARPTDGNAYGLLLERYRTSTAFRDAVDTVAGGLGLVVLGAPPRSGLVLTTQPGSVFAVRMADLRGGNLSADDKLIAGLVVLGIAAYAFPHDADLDAAEVKIVEVAAIDRFIRDAVDRLPEEDAYRRAADVYRRTAAFKPKDRQPGPARGCTQFAVLEVLGWLVERGAARQMPQMGPASYQLTDRFRLLVADMAGGEALESMRAVRAVRAEAPAAATEGA
ncbi:hypothetical protein Dfulv_12720 [Dactylosporangium fulvum]|uniref:Serine/threonine protein kinase n=1 Tax=Dactylosporangium fulvum TaxID=53359 RepID=A0ABY5W6M8_9ACTN|nr:hypothetical protein [Dactylosporangium fulvum]UWP85035.1 hypothetical protein Dfulv_12720 [Dactylosporangium fulvum]